MTSNYTIWPCDCRTAMSLMDAESVDSIVTDPPYGLSKEPDMAEVLKHWLAGDDYEHAGNGFMNAAWDSFVPGPAVWREAYRVLKPGGHLVAFFGTRTYDLGVMALRLAGFEVRDQLAWVFGCLDEETEAVTSDGVKPYHKIVAGDLVLCYDAATGGYSYQPVQEVVVYDYEDTAYRLIGDFGEQVVSRNHRCIVERDGRETFVYAESLQPQERVPVLESLPALREALRDSQPLAESAEPGPQEIRGWGGHKTTMVRVVPFQKRGKVWCLRVPTGAFVAVRGGVAFPTGNSGFPKSHSVGKAITAHERHGGSAPRNLRQARMGDDYEPTGQEDYRKGRAFGGDIKRDERETELTENALQWQGWGTALKPAYEPIVLCRKPLSERTVAANVLRWGTGAVNIDACRVPGVKPQVTQGVNSNASSFNIAKERRISGDPNEGRWPANLAHDGSPEVLAEFPDSKAGVQTRPKGSGGIWSDVSNDPCGPQYGDSGSAARFFYCAKASKADRNRGLVALPVRNTHPTVKPTALMQWLVRMVTPPDGTVLDPFMGSGSTGVAAMLEHMQFIGCEMTDEYIPIATARIDAAVS